MKDDARRDSVREQLRRNLVALISLLVALSSLGYNTWRNEQTEANRNVRHAGFALIEEMASLQRTLFGLRYRSAPLEPSVQDGWIHVLTIRDFCHAMPAPVQGAATSLLETWERESRSARSPEAYEKIDRAIDELRDRTLAALRGLD